MRPRKEILKEINKEQKIDITYNPFGDGHSADKIVALLEEYGGKDR